MWCGGGGGGGGDADENGDRWWYGEGQKYIISVRLLVQSIDEWYVCTSRKCASISLPLCTNNTNKNVHIIITRQDIVIARQQLTVWCTVAYVYVRVPETLISIEHLFNIHDPLLICSSYQFYLSTVNVHQRSMRMAIVMLTHNIRIQCQISFYSRKKTHRRLINVQIFDNYLL